MTGSDLKEKAERFLNVSVKDALALDGIQEALNWLGSMGYAIDLITQSSATEDTVYDLPSDLIEIIKIETTDEDTDEKIMYLNYIVDGDSIRYGDDGDYTIYAKKNPSLAAIDNDLTIHLLLQYCVLTYLKGFILLSQGKDDRGNIQKFERDSIKAYTDLVKNKSGTNQISVIRYAQG